MIRFRTSCPIASLLAGILLLCPGPCHSAPKSVPPAAATWKIPGRALDAEGRPVAGATVYLAREDDEADQFAEPIVIAQTRTQTDGRFELTPLDSEVKKVLAVPPAAFEVWVHKPGLALAESNLVGEPPREPFLVLMQKESPLAIRLRNPDGSSCAGATVTPIYLVHRGNRWFTLPKLLEAATQTVSAADGRIEVRGGHGDVMIVAIKTARFGIQNRTVQPVSGSPAIVKLCETRTLEGRLVLPKGEKVDLSKLTAALTIESWEKEPDKNASTHPCEPRGSSGAYDHFVVHPDREGRFTIANFPKGRHGQFYFHVFGPDVMAITTGQKPVVQSFDAPPGQPLKLEIPLRTGIWASGVVRDARTKRPLPDVYFAVEAHTGAYWRATSDKEGRLRFCLSPKEPYQVHCRLPPGYLRVQPDFEDDVVVPSGAASYEMKPIELVPVATVEGDVLDLSGKPLAAVRIIGTVETDDRRPAKRPASVSRWTTTDAAGRFHLENVDGGTKIKLVAVRDGIPIAGPAEITAGDKPVRLNEKKCERVSLAGRVVGLDRQPVPGADVVIEVEHSPDLTCPFRITLDAEGKFETPPRFPKDLKYRMTVRSILVDIASSAWMCPAVSGNRFLGLAVDRSKLALDKRLTGKEIVARVNGQPILASELFERASTEPLPPRGISLFAAADDPGKGLDTDFAIRTLQETAIRKYVGEYIRTRLLTQALMADADKDKKQKIESSIEKMFDEYVEKLKKDLKAGCPVTVDEKLHRQGTSLASLKTEFRYHLLADEFEREAGSRDQEVDWKECFAYLQAHRELYAEPERVAWRLLEIQLEIPSARRAATPCQSVNAKAPVGPAFNLDFESTTPQPGATSAAESGGFDGSASEAAKKPAEVDVAAYAEPLPPRLDRRKARRMAEEALSRLRKGVPFDDVAKSSSNGPNADRGGWQARINPNSIAEPETAAALCRLPEDETSGVIETENSFRIVRVVSRTPAGTKPFDEVEDQIKQVILAGNKKRALEDLYSRSTIECPYLDDPSFLSRPSPACSSATTGNTDDAFAP